MKMSIKPRPKGMPLSMGATNEVSPSRAEKPSQKRETTKVGPPTRASGRRRYSSRVVQGLPAATADARMPSQAQKMGRLRRAPAPMGR